MSEDDPMGERIKRRLSEKDVDANPKSAPCEDCATVTNEIRLLFVGFMLLAAWSSLLGYALIYLYKLVTGMRSESHGH